MGKHSPKEKPWNKGSKFHCLKMSVMDGIEVTRQIKAFRQDVPVIAVTAHAMSGDEQRIRAAGCDNYIAKPLGISIAACFC